MSKFTEFAEKLSNQLENIATSECRVTMGIEDIAYMIELLEKAEKCRKKAKRYKRMLLAEQRNVLKVDPTTTLNPRDAEITGWETVLYFDTEHNCSVSKAQLFDEYKAMADTGTIDSDETFNDYISNCTSKNGTLVRIQ